MLCVQKEPPELPPPYCNTIIINELALCFAVAKHNAFIVYFKK